MYSCMNDVQGRQKMKYAEQKSGLWIDPGVLYSCARQVKQP